MYADAHRLVGSLESSEEHAQAAIALVAKGSDRWFDAARLLLHTSGACGHVDTVVALSEQLLQIPVSEPPHPVHAITLLIASSELVRVGRRDLALSVRTVAHAVAGRLGTSNLTVFARAERVRAFERGTEGDMQGMLEHQTRAIEAFEAVGDLRGAALVRPDVGYACLELGLYEDAVQALRRALDDARRFGLTSAVSMAQHNLGMALGRLGQLEEAEKVEWDALRSLSGTGNRRMDGGTRLYLAEILQLAGKLEGAEREARTALEMLAVHAPLVGYAHTQLAKVLLARGANVEALEHATKAMACLEGGVEAGEVLIRMVYADALVANGRREEARPVLAIAKEQIEARAAAITNPALRLKFLTAVPEHARVLELAW